MVELQQMEKKKSNIVSCFLFLTFAGVAGDFIGIHRALSAIHSFSFCHTAFPDLAMSQISGKFEPKKHVFLTALFLSRQ